MRFFIVLVFSIFFLSSCGNTKEILPLKPGDTFKDCAECPEMVVIPAGEFVMGAREYDSRANLKRETPTILVKFIEGFAMGTHEVTRAEYLRCVDAGACKYNPPVMAWEKQEPIDLRTWPIVYISWEEAKIYVDWLSEEAGHQYSLPSEAEWEYAARGGTSTIYWWGDELEQGRAHCAYCGRSGHLLTGKYRTPVRIGSYAPNPFGLYDVVGNITEFTSDCFVSSLEELPRDGSAYSVEGCSMYAVRGGSFTGASSRYTRISARGGWRASQKAPYIGFRVKRTIHPYGK